MVDRIRDLVNVYKSSGLRLGRPKVVLQCEFATTDHSRKLIVSSGFNSCVVVAFQSDRQGGVAHLDVRTDIKRSFSEVVFPRLDGNFSLYTARLFGGIRSVSDRLASEILSELKMAGITGDRKGLFRAGGYRGLLLNSQIGRISPFNMRINFRDELMNQRLEENIRYLCDNPNQRVVRFVES